jgi:hypothetical protein
VCPEKPDFMESLTVNVRNHVKQAYTFLEDLLCRMSCGDVTVHERKWFSEKEHMDGTDSIINQCFKNERETFNMALSLRWIELHAVQTRIENIDAIVKHCQPLFETGRYSSKSISEHL